MSIIQSKLDTTSTLFKGIALNPWEDFEERLAVKPWIGLRFRPDKARCEL